MATIEKVKKKKAAPKTPSTAGSKPTEEKEKGSVISVKEATSIDQHDTVEKGAAEENTSEKSATAAVPLSPSRPTSATNRPASASNRPVSASSRPASAASRKSLSPQQQQQMMMTNPTPADKTMGSMASLKSKEAWTDVPNSPVPAAGESRPTSAVSRTSAKSATQLMRSNSGSRPSTPNTTNNPLVVESDSRPVTPNTAGSRPVTPNTVTNQGLAGSRWFRTKNAVVPVSDRPATSSERPATSSTINANVEPITNTQVQSFGPAEMNESHAYVPYLYARGAIGKVVADMKNMKMNHIRIVHDIEDNFRSIEDETQAQFNLFVLNLRDQYGVKVKTFRQVIEVHRLELQQKEQYWDELLHSLSGRNTALLKDKKVLLIQNKVEFERLEKEKNEAILALTTKLDETNAAHAKELKEQETSYEEKLKEQQEKHENDMKEQAEKHAEETKVLNDQLETEKAEVERLTKLLEEAEQNKEQAVAAAAIVTTQAVASAEPAVVDLSEEDRARMEAERGTMATEREAMTADRAAIDKEREEFAAQRRKYQEDQVVLQGDLNNAVKEREEWKIKYESLHGQLGELAELKAKYEALSAQFAAVSTLAVAAAVADSAQTDENINKKEADRELMSEEKTQMDKDIEKWETEFKEKNNRDPTDEEKPDSIKELYTSRAEADSMIKNLEEQINTLETLKKGEVPTVAAVAVAPIAITEPEIRTVEVKVPDPEVVAALQAAETTIDELKSQLNADKDEMSGLRGDISNVQSELDTSRAENGKLEAKIGGLEAQLAAGLAVGVAAGEAKDLEDKLKKVEKEKKGISKELKVALKANAKVTADAETSKKLLEVTVKEAREVTSQAEKAAELLSERLTEAKANTTEDEDHKLRLQALEMLSTGAVPEKPAVKVQAAVAVTAAVDSEALDQLKEENEELKTNNTELEGEVERLEKELHDLRDKLASGADLDATAVAMAASSGDDLEELSGQMSELQQQVDEAEARYTQEKSAHAMTRDELEAVQAQLEALRAELEEKLVMHVTDMEAAGDKSKAEINNLQAKVASAEARVEELEKARLANVPLDTQKEIKTLKSKLTTATKEKDAKVTANASLEAEIKQMKTKMAALEKTSSDKKAASAESDQKLKQLKAEKDKELKDTVAKYEKRESDRAKQEEKKIAALEKKIQQLEIAAAAGAGAAAGRAGTAKGKPEKGGAADKQLQEKLRTTQRELKDAENKIKQLENELKSAQKGGSSIEADREKKKQEKVLKELEKKLDQMMKKNEKNEENLKKQKAELEEATADNTAKDKEIAKLKAELGALGAAAAEGLENAAKVKELSAQVKELNKENKELTENYNTERILRKKYYNMVEDMKGKIRVYCRVRPMSKSETGRGCSQITKSPDEYTIHVESSRGLKEFQFDNVFMPDSSQEKVFEDTNNLIQSAVDGYNVCIFAYGQTGSGKTYTVIGDSAGNNPGIAPRAFQRIYELAEEQKAKFSFKVSVYMLELYNDKLLDLFNKSTNEDKMDIKKDKKGMVVVQGAEVKEARNANELWSLFEEGSKTRHVASTKMNAESSRSHLVIGIVIESTNRVSGQVTKGKLSLVDLAGSERAAKTEASAEQLKEAMSINKSLSALGDVISALSSEQSFIPYRNNKLTMLMQDSLGGNAKTLMFVNVSPADYNADETVTSLVYAARVKLITNDASKNADNKEIARLKGVIAKLKRGEAVDEEAEEEAAE